MKLHQPDQRPRVGFYTESYLPRSETFFYRQASGMTRVNARVLACWGVHLDEFPVDSLFLVEEYRTLPARIRSYIARRLDRTITPKGQLSFHSVKSLANSLNREPLDVLYTFFGWNAAQLVAVLDELDRPIPFIFTVGGTDIIAPHLFGPDYLPRLLAACDRAELILASSSFLRNRLISLGVQPAKVRVHYCGIDLPSLPAHRDDVHKCQRFDVLAVSRMTASKGIPHTLRAFAQVAHAVPGARLHIIGDGEEREAINSLVDDLGLRDRVTLAGSQPLKTVYAAMARADVFVQHSVRTDQGQEEALGVSLLEAAAHGLPIVSTRSGGIPEAVLDGETGILVAPRDEPSMASALIKLAEDVELRQAMGQAGRARIQEHFNIRTLNRELEEIFLKLCRCQ